MSYPNFIWGPLFFGLRPLFDHFKMFNTHFHVFHKVLGHFGKKTAKNTKAGGELIKHRGCAQETSSHSRRRAELINYGVRSGIFLKKPLGGNHLHFDKKKMASRASKASVKFLKTLG